MMTSTTICVLSILLAAAPVFPPSPRLAALNGKPQATYNTATADAILNQGLVVPDGPGDWIFYYSNEENGNQLKPNSLTEHVDTKTGKVFTDERTIAAYRTILHNKLNREVEQVAWAAFHTGDAKYAVPVRDALLKLADDYDTYPRRRDRWGRRGIFARLGGRRYSQSLSEAVGIIPLCRAYDIVRDSTFWTDAQRKHVEEDFFRATADCLLRFNQGINNHQTWYNAGLMHIANILGDADMVNRVLTMKGGFYHQLEDSIDADGMWYEGTVAYHFYAYSAMSKIVVAAKPLGLNLDEDPRYQAMLTGPPKLVYPNGQFPAINDSDRTFLRNYQGYYPTPPQPATESMNLTGAGLAILRRGAGDSAACAMIDYGPHGAGHGHFDKLQLLVYANGREWLLDPGRLTYRHKHYKTWVKHTAAHNTIAINGQSQLPTEGQTLFFTVTDDYAACGLASDAAFPHVTLRRYVLMTDTFLIDQFDVESKTSATIDWFAHVQSDAMEQQGKPADPLGDDQGYQHLTNVAKLTGHRFAFTADNKTFAIVLPTDDNEQRFRADAIGYKLEQVVPTLVRRREGKTATYLAAYDFTGNAINSIDNNTLTTTTGTYQFTFGPTGVTWESISK